MRPISIHALLAESDGGRQRCKTKRGISIHALLAESDRWHWPDRQSFSRFLSTLSLRRATEGRRARYCYGGYFYPRSPCGERRADIDGAAAILGFLSTLSLRRATFPQLGVIQAVANISIHALLAESDNLIIFNSLLVSYFYPRSPCGERLRTIMSQPAPWAFLSTLSLRRATHAIEHRHKPNRYFYPRSPCGERPHHPMRQNRTSVHFYPRSPCGERPVPTLQPWHAANFYPRSPCGERQRACKIAKNGITISIHALLAESDVFVAGPPLHNLVFLSTLSLRRATSLCVTANGHHSLFLSTLSLRRATSPSLCSASARTFLSTLSLRRATRHGYLGSAALHISIHALLAESDIAANVSRQAPSSFLSTLSLRRAT